MVDVKLDEGAEASATGAKAPPFVRFVRLIALMGGVISIALALMVTLSVTLRSNLFKMGGIPGDFDLVQIGTAISIFSFLSLTQVHRGNIMVDTFTTRLPKSVNRVLDACWDFVYAGMMALLAWCLVAGTRETLANGTNSMVIGVPLGPVFAICAALFFLVALTAAYTGLKVLKARL
jgi:TRAP-type C4-dicarboxylate transport system permease small subunit